MVRAREKEKAKVEKIRNEFHKLFGKEVDITYDLRGLYDILMGNPDQTREKSWVLRMVPNEISEYLQAAINKMKVLAFGEDELYRTEWLTVASKGVIFEVVEQLQTTVIISKYRPFLDVLTRFCRMPLTMSASIKMASSN